MNMSKAWIKDPKVFQVGRLDPKASLKVYRNKEEMECDQSSLSLLLNGQWKFEYAESIETSNNLFFEKDYDLVVLAPQFANYYEDLKKDTDRLGIKSAACEGKKYIELTRNPQKALEFVFSILDGNNE